MRDNSKVVIFVEKEEEKKTLKLHDPKKIFKKNKFVSYFVLEVSSCGKATEASGSE